MSWTEVPRIGMLGHGAIGALHAEAFRSVGCQLVTVMGPDLNEAGQFARDQGFARHTDRVEDVVEAADIDAVVIASPNAAHAAQAIAALRGGKHVLCEVPVGLSLDDVLAVQAESERLICMVCHTQRFLPSIVQLRRRIEHGQLELLSLSTVMAMYRRENVGWTGRRRAWDDHLVWHHGTHAIDSALWLLGDEPVAVQAASGRPHPETGAPMDVAITITTRTGRLATLSLSYNAMTSVNDVLLIGQSETLRVRDWQLQGDNGEGGHESPDDQLTSAVHAQAHAFVRAIHGEQPALPSIDDVLPIYRCVQRVEDEIALQRSRPTPALNRKES
ncbi:Gfo/Idh/MocA family oxidoreductase [Kribbella alba]|uniref:Gfo/Idh/MocA family oxidoreductase n=1 Tax=Kribbella alba TaxID=190197 RepID=A0ABP4QY81_9ACTN